MKEPSPGQLDKLGRDIEPVGIDVNASFYRPPDAAFQQVSVCTTDVEERSRFINAVSYGPPQ
jgi:hypothetical protein